MKRKFLVFVGLMSLALTQPGFAQDQQGVSRDDLDGTLAGIGAVSTVTGFAQRARTFNRPDAWIGKGWFTYKQIQKIVDEAMRNIKKGSPEVIVTMKSELGWDQMTIRHVFTSTTRAGVEHEIEELITSGYLEPTQFKFRRIGKGLPQVFMAAGAGFMGVAATDHWELLTDRNEKSLFSPPSRASATETPATPSSASANAP